MNLLITCRPCRQAVCLVAVAVVLGATRAAYAAEDAAPHRNTQDHVGIVVHAQEDRDPVRVEHSDIVLHAQARPGEKPRVIGTPTPPKPPPPPRSEVTWLGVSTDEAPEALTAQLKLNPGVGLVVSHVVENSPASKAELKVNDLLIRLNDQELVHPAQLRKLVHTRKPGDKITLQLMRAGEKHSVEVTLAQTEGLDFLGEGFRWPDLKPLLHETVPVLRQEMGKLRDHLGELKLEHQRIKPEIQRSLEEARRAVEEAFRKAGEAKEAGEWSRTLQKELRRTGEGGGYGSVTFSTAGKPTSVRTLVKTDDSGTIHIQSSPDMELRALDPDGKLVFKGPIDTQEQRDAVPRELWQRVEPLLKQLKVEDDE